MPVLPEGLAAMVLASEAYAEESYADAAAVYDEAAITLEPADDEIPELTDSIDLHPDRTTTEHWTAMAASVRATAGTMADAATPRDEGDADLAEEYEAESGIEDLPHGYQP